MRRKPKLFTPGNTYPIIRVMLGSVGLNIQPRRPRLGEQPIICNHEHIDILVLISPETQIPYIVFTTKNERNFLMSVTFDGADQQTDTGPRCKRAVGGMSKDRSLYNALALYLTMCEAADEYIDQHFNLPRFAEVFVTVQNPVRIDP